jgi:hypothetical protein
VNDKGKEEKEKTDTEANLHEERKVAQDEQQKGKSRGSGRLGETGVVGHVGKDGKGGVDCDAVKRRVTARAYWHSHAKVQGLFIPSVLPH